MARVRKSVDLLQVDLSYVFTVHEVAQRPSKTKSRGRLVSRPLK